MIRSFQFQDWRQDIGTIPPFQTTHAAQLSDKATPFFQVIEKVVCGVRRSEPVLSGTRRTTDGVLPGVVRRGTAGEVSQDNSPAKAACYYDTAIRWAVAGATSQGASLGATSAQFLGPPSMACVCLK